MNESQFESDLRRLRPAVPSSELSERVASQLSARTDELALASRAPQRLERLSAPAVVDARPQQQFFFWLRGLGWATAGACAALFAMRGTEFFAPQSAAPGNPPAPVAITAFQSETSSRELLEAHDEGLRYDDEQQPQRQLRLTFLERHTWTNPGTGAVLHFEVPREDVVLTPVAMQ
jgi:negative regulator of sigma E activity